MREILSRREAIKQIAGTGAAAVVGVATRGVIDELKVYDCERRAQMIERSSAGRDY